MSAANSNKTLVIETYKTFAGLIFEISRNEVITGVWIGERADPGSDPGPLLGRQLSDINNENIVRACTEAIRTVFNGGTVPSFEYRVQRAGHLIKCPVKVLQASYDKDAVLVLVEPGIDKEIGEEDWHAVLTATSDGIWDYNVQANRIFLSPKWLATFGYAPAAIQSIEDWYNNIHPEDLNGAQKMLEDHLAGRTPLYEIELRYRLNDGSYRWVLCRGLVTDFNEDNQPTRVLGVYNDIHQRRLMDLANLDANRRYKVLFDYSVALICTHDLDGKILNVNPYASELLKYSFEELVGKNVADLVPEKFKKIFFSEYLPAIRNSLGAEGVLRMLSKDGTVRHLLYKNYLFSNPEGEKYVIAFAQDITERLRAESGLRTSEKIFSTYFNLSGIGMAIVHPSGKWERVNGALCRMTGYSQEEMSQFTFGDITHPDDMEQDIEAKERLLRGELAIYEVEKRYITKDKRVIWISLTASLVRDSRGQPKFFVVQFVDITTKKALTTELQLANMELRAAKDQLLDKIKELEEISHAIGHNLRGPAKNINLLTKVLNVKLGKEAETMDVQSLAASFSVDELAAMINTVGVSMTNSLETLLNIAEIRLNRDVPYDRCDFEALIQQVSDQLIADLRRKQIAIEMDIREPFVLYPRPYLESILYNLISNAIKYSNPATASKIWIVTQRNDQGQVTLSVRDNGFGIDLDKFANKIFKLSQVFHNNTDSKGVGLYLTKTQIESLGGRITVDSKINEGALFSVIFSPSCTLEPDQ